MPHFGEHQRINLFGYFNQFQTSGLTRYISLNGEDQVVLEAEAQTPIIAGLFTEIKVRCGANTANFNTTITLRVNGVNTLLTVTIGPAATGTFIARANVPVAENDLVCWLVVTAGGAGTVTFSPAAIFR